MANMNLNWDGLNRITDENLTDAKERKRILNFLYQLTEQLQYWQNNLELSNMTTQFQQEYGEIKTATVTLRRTSAGILARVEDAEGTISRFELTVDGLEGRIENAEGSITKLQLEADGLLVRVEDAEKGVAALEIAADSIRQEVGDIQVGGVNLLPDSKKDRTVTGGRFLSIPVRDVLSPYIGKEISVSFEAKGTAGNVFSVYAYQSSGISIDKGYSFTMPTDAFQRFSFVTSVKDYTDRVGDDGTAYSLGEIAFYDTTGAQNFTIRKIKIELGNKPTSWSPCPDDPAEKLKTATAVLQEDEYYIAFNGNRVFHIDEDSAEVNADSMTVTGAFYANVPNTQGACTITVPDGASIQAAINDLGKNLTGSVEVKVNGYHAENVTIAGFFGQGALTVRFGSGAVLEGTLYASDCQCRLNLYGTNMTDRVIRGSTYGIQISNCSYVYVSTIGILGAERTALGVNAGTYGVRVLDGSYVQARNVLVEKCGRCFTVSRSVLGIQNCIGGVDSTDASSVANARWLVLEPDSFSIVIVCTGTIPMSSGGIYKVDGILEYNESSVTATGSSGEAAAVTTKTVTMTPSASKGAVYGTADGSGGYVHPWGYYTNPFQGKNSGAGGYMFGLWLYTDDYTAFYNTISGKTIQSATLTIKRANAYGVGGSTVHLFYHSLTSVASSQRPSEILTSTGLSAQVDRGKSVTFELTSDLIAKLQDGTIKGFGLSSAGSTQLMQFEGTVCDLTVVYSA